MKRNIIIILIAIFSVAAIAGTLFYFLGNGDAVCEHIDGNKDGKCDECGEKLELDLEIGDVVCSHVDKNGDKKCDKCKKAIFGNSTTCIHVDSDKNNLCDKCGLGVMLDNNSTVCVHRDATDDGRCDMCNAPYSDGNEALPPSCVHRDANDNNLCDNCGIAFEDGAEQNGSITITLSGPLTGFAAVYGNSVKEGAEKAIDEINALGGIDGIRLELKVYDDKHNSADIASIYQLMINDGMQISLGCVTSFCCGEFAELSKDSVFFLAPTASGDEIVKYSNGYQMCVSDSRQGKVVAEYINENFTNEKIGILYRADDHYSSSLHDTFVSALDSRFMSEMTQVPFSGDVFDFTVFAERLKNCDVIFIPLYFTDASDFMRQAVGKLSSNALYIGTDGIDGIESVYGFDINAIPQKIVCTMPSLEGTDFEDCFAARGYDSVYAIYCALMEAKESGVEISAEMSALEFLAVLKAVFDGDFVIDEMVTGKNVIWDESGYVEKDIDFKVIKDFNAVASDAEFKLGVILLHDRASSYDLNFINAVERTKSNLGLADEQVIYMTNIPEDITCFDTALDLADMGCDIVFANSFGHETYILQAAKERTDVQFCHAGGVLAHTENLPNFHNAYAAIHEGRYLTGVAAGLKLNQMINDGVIASDEAKIGFVGAFPYAEIISSYTAFFLGAKSVCPTVTMQVEYVNSYYYEDGEKAAAEKLILENGCVIISQYSDSLGAPTACEVLNVPNVSYNVNTEEDCPNTAIISSSINWTPYFEYICSAVMNGDEIAIDWAGNLATGSVEVSEVNNAVAASGTEEFIEEVRAKLVSGQIQVFDTANFTVNGLRVTEYLADVDFDEYYTPDTDIVNANGIIEESLYRSAPYFDLIIDGISVN